MTIQFLIFNVSDRQRAQVTVTTAGRPQMELSLEPQTFEPARVYQRALFEAGIPVTAFTTDGIAGDYAR